MRHLRPRKSPLLWFGYIDRLSQWGEEMYFTRSNNFYLPSLRLEGGGGELSAPCALNQDSLRTKHLSTDLKHPNTTYFLVLSCFSHIFWVKVGHSIVKCHWTYCTKNSKQIIPEMKLRGSFPTFMYI